MLWIEILPYAKNMINKVDAVDASCAIALLLTPDNPPANGRSCRISSSDHRIDGQPSQDESLSTGSQPRRRSRHHAELFSKCYHCPAVAETRSVPARSGSCPAHSACSCGMPMPLGKLGTVSGRANSATAWRSCCPIGQSTSSRCDSRPGSKLRSPYSLGTLCSHASPHA